MTMRILVFASLLAAASFAADAQTTAQPAPGANPEYATRRICRVTPTIGSRLGGTGTCRTKAEWDEYQRDSRLIVDHIQRVSPPCAVGSNVPGHAALICSN